MKILSVKAANFRSYEEIDWSLPDTGLFLIDGVNLDTGRNNMTGKTTIIDSIFWCLYGFLPKWGGPRGGQADAVIRRGSSDCGVLVNLEYNGKTIFIRRHRPTKLEVVVDNQVLHGKSADLDARIPELIGMTAEQFLTAVYISQDRKASFFTMGEAERTELLSTVSKVENINSALERAKKLKTDKELEIEKQKSFIEGLEAQATVLPSEKYSAQEAVDIREAELDRAKMDLSILESVTNAKIAQIEAESKDSFDKVYVLFKSEQEKLSARLSDLESRKLVCESELYKQPKVESHFSQTIEDLKTRLAEAEASNMKRGRQEMTNSYAKTALSKCADEIEAAQNGSCDHCGQNLPTHLKSEKIQEHLAHAERWKAQILDVPEAIDVAPIKQLLNGAMAAYAKRKAELDAAPAEIMAHLTTFRAEIDSAKIQMREGKSKMEAELKHLESQRQNAMLFARQNLNDAKNRHDSVLRLLEEVKRSVERIEMQIQSLNSKIQDSKVKLFALQKELDQALDLIDLFKGFRQVCFEDVIARISDRAGDLLGLMTDGIYTTRIDQMGETSKGEAKLILKPIISKGGVDVPLDDLSGGARRTVMLAYDVAVSEAIGDSSVLFLDEALDGLDSMGKGEAIRLLEEVSKTRAVFVIDHTSEIKSAIGNVINVTYQNEVSTLESSTNFEDLAAQG